MHKEVSVGCSGLVQPDTGIGVLQRRLYPMLEERGLRLIESKNRDLGRSGWLRLLGLLRGFVPSRGGEAYLVAVPPFPLALRVPTVTIIYDLRWLRTRSKASQRYRGWDLKRAVRRSSHLVCISKRTADDLAAFAPDAGAKSTVLWLGPGLMDGIDFDTASARTEKGLALLIGGSAHKQNELAAALITTLPRSLIGRVACVGVSDTVLDTLDSALGSGAIEHYLRISDAEMVDLYSRAETFVLLGTDEGFGLPFIEALSAGCTVIARRQALTEEILGDAGMLINSADPKSMAREVLASATPSEETRRETAARYDWGIVADELAALILSVRSDPSAEAQ